MSNSSESPGASANVLAAKRTHRPDPLNNFQPYSGGWNLMNMSYLASAGTTGMTSFAISLLWIILGLGILVVVGCMYICCKDHLYPNPKFDKFGNYVTLGLLVLFTVLTIAGCGALFTGQEGLHSDLNTVCTYLTTQFTAIAKASVSSVPPAGAPSAAEAAVAMEKATNATAAEISQTLDSIRIWLVILAASMLVLAMIGLVFAAYHIKPVVYTLVTIGWLLVVGTWILSGAFKLIYSVIGDTCTAMQEWAENPRAGTSFDMIMQCSSQSNSSSGSHLSIGKLPSTADDKIQATEYKFLNDIDQLYHEANYMSDDPNDGDHRSYNHFWVKKSMQQKASSTPASTDTCAKLRDSFVGIFNTIATNNCPSMSKNAKWVWVALSTLSTGSMLSICLWIVFTRRSTMRLRKVDLRSNQLPFEFEASNKKNDNIGAGASSDNHAEISLDVQGGGRRRSKTR